MYQKIGATKGILNWYQSISQIGAKKRNITFGKSGEKESTFIKDFTKTYMHKNLKWLRYMYPEKVPSKLCFLSLQDWLRTVRVRRDREGICEGTSRVHCLFFTI